MPLRKDNHETHRWGGPRTAIMKHSYFHKSIRLKGYDYTQPGAYFVTTCSRDRKPVFGTIIDGEIVLNDWGEIVRDLIEKIPDHFSNIEIDQSVIMPNHVHMIIVIWHNNESGNGTACRATTRERFGKPVQQSIPTIIRSFKSAVSKQINTYRKSSGQSIWQRNYYEHIIRDERELNRIRRYVINNPPKWEYDRENRNGIPIDEKRKFWDRFLNEYN